MMGMTANRIPVELDWVQARMSCTVAEVFNKLWLAIEIDVATLNAAKKLSEDLQFKVDRHPDGGTICVWQPKKVPSTRVLITAAADKIKVTQESDTKNWSVTLGLNDEGRCILRLCDEKGEPTAFEMEHWQFRKKALESLFFGVRP